MNSGVVLLGEKNKKNQSDQYPESVISHAIDQLFFITEKKVLEILQRIFKL